MKITVREISGLVNNQVLSTLLEKEAPVKVAYSFNKIFKKLNKEYAKFLEKRNDLIKDYAEKNEDGTIKAEADQDTNTTKFAIPTDKIEDFNTKINELLNEEIEIDEPLIPLSRMESMSLSTDLMMVIDQFITDDTVQA
jgi:hypothetical protein